MDPRLTSAVRLQQQKNYPAAEQIYRQILRVEGGNVDALLLLGLLLHETGRNEESVTTLRAALRIQPQRTEVRQTLASALMALRRLPEAIVEAKELVRLRPMVAEMHHALARLLMEAPDPTGALPYARRAVELQPRSPAMFVTLGRVYQQLNAIADAVTAVDKALAIDPRHADALVDKAIFRQAQGRLDEAIALYESALKLAPRNGAALNNLGSCYLMKMRCYDAIRCFETAGEVLPASPKPPNNLGAVLKEMGQIDQALPHFHKAAQIDPNYADAYCNIGASYATIGEHKLAIAAFREALRVRPNFSEVGSNLLLSLLSPTDISPQEVFAEHVAWAKAHTAGLQNNPARWTGMPTNRRIRVGYVSADFREHSVRYFMEPIFSAYDRSQFETVCYATGRRRDEVTDRLAKMVDAWHFVAELNDQQLADLIRSHQIDILVDLAGHTSDHRLLTFARKPAPVQVTYLGYPTTTGLGTIDYRLTDPICELAGAEAFYTERLIRLPHAFFVYGDEPQAWFDPVLPADRNGFVTFGSFNSFTKINDETLESWAAILRGVPNSRLFMKARPLENPSTKQRIVQFFSDRGVAPNRLDLRAWVSLEEHTKMLGSAVDLMLDTFPYNGHTTSCQAIWRGVPVVTRSGDSFRSRVGECILRHLDLADFIASSKEQYERIAIEKALDLSRLRELRPLLRRRMMDSPLGNPAQFVRELENAYRKMLQSKSGQTLIDQALELHQQGRLGEALEAYQKGIKLDPTNAAGLNNLGACYLALGRADEGIQILKKAAQANPTEPRSRNNIGTALEDLGRFDQAIEEYKAAYAIDPNYAEALNNLGGAYGLIGRTELAIASYREALRIQPDFPIAHSNMLLAMLYLPDLPEAQVYAEHLRWAATHAGQSGPAAAAAQTAGSRRGDDAHRRLRIGYVSPDFRDHPVRYFIEPVLASHDRSQFEIFCYAETGRQDAVTQRLMKLADHWLNVTGQTDLQLAQRIRADEIDILVDLAGHTSDHRLLTFARSPAPVQVTYLGYPATTGLSAIQYRFTDSITDPPDAETFCVEKLVRLPHAFFTFGYDDSIPYEPRLPADANGFFTFGSFNNFAKINEPVLRAWANILKAMPRSRLVFNTKPLSNPSTRLEIAQFFADRGIAADRLDLIGSLHHAEFCRRVAGVDLALDPYPFHGHTTSCQSIWMGVPFVTRAGNVFRSRMGVSILHHLNLPEFVAHDWPEYERIAIAMASDPQHLRSIRPTLRQRMRNSPLCDAAGFTRDLEQAYREIWRGS